jgi:hypothetical protein
MIIDKEIKKEIANALNINNLTVEQQDEIINGLMVNATLKIDMAILDRLTEEETKHLNKLDQEDKLAYLSLKIEDLSELVKLNIKEVVDEFKKIRSK